MENKDENQNFSYVGDSWNQSLNRLGESFTRSFNSNNNQYFFVFCAKLAVM